MVEREFGTGCWSVFDFCELLSEVLLAGVEEGLSLVFGKGVEVDVQDEGSGLALVERLLVLRLCWKILFFYLPSRVLHVSIFAILLSPSILVTLSCNEMVSLLF